MSELLGDVLIDSPWLINKLASVWRRVSRAICCSSSSEAVAEQRRLIAFSTRAERRETQTCSPCSHRYLLRPRY